MVNQVMDLITSYDKEVGEAIQAECARQRRNLELIASENIVSEPVMMAMGTVLTNKYAEGYSGKRYYGGCQCVDAKDPLVPCSMSEEITKANPNITFCPIEGAKHMNCYTTNPQEYCRQIDQLLTKVPFENQAAEEIAVYL